jgi:hypothetical protein
MNKIQLHSQQIVEGILHIIETARNRVAVYVNAETTLLYFEIGRYINQELRKDTRAQYGAKILATVSQELTLKFGKGYTYSALTRMSKVANVFNLSIVVTMSQQLSWSHLIELSGIKDDLKREFFTQICISEKWGVRQLREKIEGMLFERTAIASQPEEIIKIELQKLRENNETTPDLVFKNTNVLDFLNLPNHYSEEEKMRKREDGWIMALIT